MPPPLLKAPAMSATQDPSDLDIREEHLPTGARLVIAGEIDAASAPQLERAALAACKRGGDIWLDLARVPFLDSSGLRVLVAVRSELQAAECELHLVNVDRRVMRVLEATHLDKVLSVTPAVDSAR